MYRIKASKDNYYGHKYVTMLIINSNFLFELVLYRVQMSSLELLSSIKGQVNT